MVPAPCQPEDKQKMNDIRMLIFIVIAMLFLALTQGCVHTTFEKTADGFAGSRTAFLYPFKTGVKIDADTGLITFDYNTDGGKATAEGIAAAVTREAIRGTK